MGTVKFNDGNFYLNGEYIGSGKLTSATETVRQKDARIKFLEEQLIHEQAKNKKLCSVLNEFEAYFDTPQELSDFIANASNENAELKVAMEKLRQEAITIDMVEKAAFDILSWYVKDEDAHGGSRNGSMFAITQDHALALMLTTRLVERIKYYVKKR